MCINCDVWKFLFFSFVYPYIFPHICFGRSITFSLYTHTFFVVVAQMHSLRTSKRVSANSLMVSAINLRLGSLVSLLLLFKMQEHDSMFDELFCDGPCNALTLGNIFNICNVQVLYLWIDPDSLVPFHHLVDKHVCVRIRKKGNSKTKVRPLLPLKKKYSE